MFEMLTDDTELVKEVKEVDPTKYVADRNPASSIHYNLRTLSYSGLLTLHSCPRKFELSRLIPRMTDVEVDEDEHGHLDFGTVVGNGVQVLLTTHNLNAALFRVFLDWNDNLDSDRGEKSKKTFWHAIQAVSLFQEMLHGPFARYEVAQFHGKPATELGFAIDCGEGFTLRGKLDALLVHRNTNEFLPLECKTTGVPVPNEAMYGNSSQGIGYGVVIDTVAQEGGEEIAGYTVGYPVYLTRKAEWVYFPFPKTNTSRALWLQSLLMDIQDIQRYHDMGYFPQRGEHCFTYNKPCKWYGTCHLANEYLVGPVEKLPVKYDKVGEFPLEFSIDQLVEAQIAKGQEGEGE